MTMPTILVVDDDAAIRDLLSEVFECEGYHAITAANGAEALQLLESWHPSVILLDVTMPILDGLDVARELRRRGSPIPTLILSALDEAGQDTQALCAGRLGKPFDLFVLLSTIERYCAGWQDSTP